MQTRAITGELEVKVVASALKKLPCDQLVFTRFQDFSILVSTAYLQLRLPSYMLQRNEFSSFAFPEEWEQASFASGRGQASRGEEQERVRALWSKYEAKEPVWQLARTLELKEAPSSEKHKTGVLYRQFTGPNHTVLLDKRACDLLTPDGDELEGFLFEQFDGPRGGVRVSAHNGHAAYIAPATLNR